MNCPAFETLSIEVDGETTENERTALRAHVATCARCQAVRTRLLVLKAAVHAAGDDPGPVSEALRARVERLRPRRSGKRRRPLFWIAAGAVPVVLAGALLLWVTRGSGKGEPFVVQLVGDHVVNALGHEKPLEILSEDPRVVESWFRDKADFAVTLPRVADARLVGGRLCSVGGRRALLAFYDSGPRRMSLFALAAEAGASRPPCVEGVRGFTVCRRISRGVEYALVSDLPASHAERLLEAAW